MHLFTKESIEMLKKLGATDETIKNATPIKKVVGTAVLAQQVEGEDADPEDARDAMGRTYADEVFERLSGLNSDPTAMSPIPDAGAGPTLETTTEGIAYRPQRFTTSVGGRLVKPNAPYELPIEGMEPGSGPVRIGESWLMNPQASGIATPLNFQAPAPAAVTKRAPGIFKDLIEPRDGEPSNFFSTAQSDAKIAKSKGGLFTSLVFDEK